jgi:hypothetical protein
MKFRNKDLGTWILKNTELMNLHPLDIQRGSKGRELGVFSARIVGFAFSLVFNLHI